MGDAVAQEGLRRALTHPLGTTAGLCAAAVGVFLAWSIGLPAAPTVAWVVLALAAGYAISGSV